MYDDITRIPLIIRSPQGERRQVDTPVSHIDLLPTMMALADIENQRFCRGKYPCRERATWRVGGI